MLNKQLLNEGSSSRGDRQNSLYMGKGTFSGVRCGKKKSLEVVPSVQGGKQEIWSALSRERLELLIQSSLSLIFIYLICNREVCLGGHSSLCKVWIEQKKHGLLSKRLSYRLIFLVFILFYWA